ncbi:DUF4232 domain-containing protein [Kitasatospora sp. NPDC048298]|uniref:DUF4232 domain-containing protein n=1 Tax=Kitasatospora sp. NPDC048298 TaxID=3364049 RepID=UPI0037181D72
MRTAARLIATAAVALTAGLALTACDGPGAGSEAAGSAPSAAGSAPSAPAPAASGTTAAASSGAGASSGAASATTGGGSGGSGTAAGSKSCTPADVKLSVTGPTSHASEQQPATAIIRAVNTSGRSCTLSGFPGVQLADDQGKSSAIDAVRHDGGPNTPVTLAPGAQATADLLYSDVNGQATASGRYVCSVTGSKVSIILPNTTQQVQVAVTGGVDNGTLSVCGDLNVDPFASSRG